MNYTEKLNKVVVKITSNEINGSGIILLPSVTSTVVYVLTAKHCIFGKNFDNNATFSDICLEKLGGSDKKYQLQSTDKILFYQENEPDIAVLVIPKAAIEEKIGEIPCIYLSPLDIEYKKCAFKGFPKAMNNQVVRTITNCNIIHEDSNDKTLHIQTKASLKEEEDFTKVSVQGFSGSGVFAHSDDDIYLLGLVTEIEDWNKRFICANISCIFDLLPDVRFSFETQRNTAYLKFIGNASTELSKIKNYFGEDKNSHTDRDETTLLHNWIKADLSQNQKNIALLVGEAGRGKTIVFKDLYDILIKNNIPTLAIKADKNTATSRVDLEHKLFQKSDITIENIFKSLTTNNRKAVILIDQIDALSLTMSSDRSFLTTYSRLICELSENPNIRIIISIRKYDLEYDAEFSNYKENDYHKIDIDLLEKEFVINFLQNLSIHNPSEKLVELLRTPNHLDIFCRLGNKEKANIDKINSLQDLHKGLWEDIVAKAKKEQQLNNKLLLYAIAKKMYETQGISVSNTFSDDYDKELSYLKSKTIILEDDKGLSFFHQTFYDYVFSKQFVENNQSLPDYIIENQQSLYVRAVIKMVLTYLKEHSLTNYLTTIKALITEDKYRFHIKSLVLNTIGLSPNPAQKEKDFVLEYILPNFKYAQVFIEAIYDKDWFEFLIQYDIINQYLVYDTDPKEQETKLNLISNLFRKNAKDNTTLIVDCLEKLPDFQAKKPFIDRALINIKYWKDERLLSFFEEYCCDLNTKQVIKGHFTYNMLEEIAVYHKEYALEKLRGIIKDFFDKTTYFANNFDYEHQDLIKNINKTHPKDAFEMLFAFMEEDINHYIYPIDVVKGSSSLHRGKHFSDNGFVSKLSKEADVFIFELLEHYICNLAKYNQEEFLDFYETHKHSNATPILKLLFAGIKANTIFQKQFLELINIFNSKKGFEASDNRFSLYVRLTVVAYFPTLSEAEKSQIVDILLDIRSVEDTHFYEHEGKKKLHLTFYKKQYMFIKALPLNEIEANQKLKKRYLELERKFGKIKEDLLRESRFSSYGIGAPLPQKAYTNMKEENWKETMLKYNAEYERHWGSDKGGILEHSRQFEAEVKANPQKHIALITEIVDDENISASYGVAGISGLVEGNYKPKVVLGLFKIIIKRDLNKEETLHLVWKMNYFINSKIIDKEIIDFLVDLILHHEDPSRKHNDLLSDTLNTVRGAAIEKLIFCSYNQDFREIIFNTIEKAVDDPQPAVRTSILLKLAYLNHLDLQRALNIFLKLTETDNIEILQHSTWSASYFIFEYYDKMQDFINKLICLDVKYESFSVLIFNSWYHNKDNSSELLEKFILKGDKAILALMHSAEHYLFDNNIVNEKPISLFKRFLNKDDDEFAHQYSGLILRKFKINHFEQTFDFLSKYAKSKLCNMNKVYFLKYLTICARQFPEKCLDLFEYLDFDERPNIQRGNYYDREPLLTILSIYSSLNAKIPCNKKYIEKTLDKFDAMLQSDVLRKDSNEALEIL